METKIDDRPKERIQFKIEFADNGIIIRNEDMMDEIKLALISNNHAEEYRIIGEKIYYWLVSYVIPEHADYWTAVGAELDITATLIGRHV